MLASFVYVEARRRVGRIMGNCGGPQGEARHVDQGLAAGRGSRGAGAVVDVGHGTPERPDGHLLLLQLLWLLRRWRLLLRWWQPAQPLYPSSLLTQTRTSKRKLTCKRKFAVDSLARPNSCDPLVIFFSCTTTNLCESIAGLFRSINYCYSSSAH